MGTRIGEVMNRRQAMSAVAISGAALVGAGVGRAAGPALAQRSVTSGGGIAGGGLLQGPDAVVHFSLFATRLPLGADEAMIVSGQIRLHDPQTGLRMESVAVAEYGPVGGEDENLRQLSGTMLVRMTDDDEGVEYPFVLRAVDAGEPGAGLDTVHLQVGGSVPATPESGSFEFSYELNGAVAAGDIALVDIALA